MERLELIDVRFTEDEAYELLTRSASNTEDDNPAFRSALRKLAEAIKGERRRVAA